MNTLFNQCLRIEDTSTYPRPNQIISSTFKTMDFELGNVNETILKNYTITDCLAWEDFGIERFSPIVAVNTSEYQINYENQIVWKIENSSENVDYQISLPPGDNSNLKIKLEIGHSIKIIRHLNLDFQRDLIISTFNAEGLINDEGSSIIIESTQTPQIIVKLFIYIGKNDNDQDLWRML